MQNINQKQQEICNKYGVSLMESDMYVKAGVARNVKDGVMPLNGLRLPPEGDTSGWFIWAGEDFLDSSDFFVPLHIVHLVEWCPETIKFLGLPVGYRFLIDKEGYEDVWYDESILGA